MQDPRQIIAELEKLDGRIKAALEKIIGRNPSREEMLRFLASEEFDNFLDDMGLRKALRQYITGFDVGLASDLRGVSGFTGVDLTAQQIQRISANLDIIKNSYARTILGYAKANADLLRSRLINSIVNGVTATETVKGLEGQLISTLTNAPLNTAQIGTVINTSYADYSRTATAEVFKDKPEQRFYYEGGVIPTSSDECRWLVENQKKEGYTKAEIDKGIETPFIHTSGDMKGQKKIINWFGRNPNYNCIHTWLPR